MTRKTQFAQRRPLSLALIGVLGLGASLPAFAETEIEALKRELAEQKALIQSILAERKADKAAVSGTSMR